MTKPGFIEKRMKQIEYVFWEHDTMSDKNIGTKCAITNKQLNKQPKTMKKSKGKGGKKKGC